MGHALLSALLKSVSFLKSQNQVPFLPETPSGKKGCPVSSGEVLGQMFVTIRDICQTARGGAGKTSSFFGFHMKSGSSHLLVQSLKIILAVNKNTSSTIS